MNNVRPRMQMLTEEQIQDIHRYTLQVLETTGVRVDSPSAVAMLEKRVGSANVKGRSVRIPRELVEWAIKVAQRQIQIFDRRGNPQFTIGREGDRTRFGIGVTALYYQEVETDTPVLFQRKHMQDMVRVGNKLPLYDKLIERRADLLRLLHELLLVRPQCRQRRLLELQLPELDTRSRPQSQGTGSAAG